jgi:hypothetical protein
MHILDSVILAARLWGPYINECLVLANRFTWPVSQSASVTCTASFGGPSFEILTLD